jgi:hypothetical protein
VSQYGAATMLTNLNNTNFFFRLRILELNCEGNWQAQGKSALCLLIMFTTMCLTGVSLKDFPQSFELKM